MLSPPAHCGPSGCEEGSGAVGGQTGGGGGVITHPAIVGHTAACAPQQYTEGYPLQTPYAPACHPSNV